MCWRTSIDPARTTDPLRRSTAGSNTSEAQPSASATSPTTSPDAYSKPADSDPDYTLDSEEPRNCQPIGAFTGMPLTLTCEDSDRLAALVGSEMDLGRQPETDPAPHGT